LTGQAKCRALDQAAKAASGEEEECARGSTANFEGEPSGMEVDNGGEMDGIDNADFQAESAEAKEGQKTNPDPVNCTMENILDILEDQEVMRII